MLLAAQEILRDPFFIFWGEEGGPVQTTQLLKCKFGKSSKYFSLQLLSPLHCEKLPKPETQARNIQA